MAGKRTGRKNGRPAWAPTPEEQSIAARSIAVGMSIEMVAHLMKRDPLTLRVALDRLPGFLAAVNEARSQARGRLVTMFYQMAMGEHPSQRVVDALVPVVDGAGNPVKDAKTGEPVFREVTRPGSPNMTAAVFWAKNVLGWRDARDRDPDDRVFGAPGERAKVEARALTMSPADIKEMHAVAAGALKPA
jgi:hypothetical protein